MLRIVQRNKIYWLRAAANATTLGSMFVCMLICVVILWRSSVIYASENLEIQKVFGSVVKHIKADKNIKILMLSREKVTNLISKFRRILARILTYTLF